ncbi:NAD-dependent protein deacetylase Sirt6 [Condylostylus longicornis]|uniref:NAD-dependent protein deacetylase Sirt6 n=1 Tax=Condylostylus longicornis TaxID=2530218 RepID=UPI00244E0E82|nr:NAD-dependent protein deacetylase Sirt6 [Condylostylus longicornis]
MSCNYAEGLSPYENKGILGLPEKFDDEKVLNDKCESLVSLLETSKHVVFHTGAGISTSVGIPDFRGPKGVWTLEQKGEKPNINVSFDDAIPSKTHMAIKALVEKGYIHYVVSQNIDGLHLKSGLQRKFLAELHGNMFIEQCNKCKKQYVRNKCTTSVGQKYIGGLCRGGGNSRACRGGQLIDNILDWEADLPDRDLELSFLNSSLADLNVCLGTTLQIVPSGNLPLKNKKFGGKLIICNLQPTKHDKKADLIISGYVDVIMSKVCKRLGIEIPDYNVEDDPTKMVSKNIEWTIQSEQIKETDKVYSNKLKDYNKKRKLNGDIEIKDKKENFKKIKKKKEDI